MLIISFKNSLTVLCLTLTFLKLFKHTLYYARMLIKMFRLNIANITNYWGKVRGNNEKANLLGQTSAMVITSSVILD